MEHATSGLNVSLAAIPSGNGPAGRGQARQGGAGPGMIGQGKQRVPMGHQHEEMRWNTNFD